MYYKAIFNNTVDEKKISDFSFNIYFNEILGVETINFNDYEFEITRDIDNQISEITFVNQCTRTQNIENEFLTLVEMLLDEEDSVTLFESNGSSEVLFKDNLQEYL